MQLMINLFWYDAEFGVSNGTSYIYTRLHFCVLFLTLCYLTVFVSVFKITVMFILLGNWVSEEMSNIKVQRKNYGKSYTQN
jgi:hypothetical protein